MYICIYIYVCMYRYIYVYTEYVYIYIFIHIYPSLPLPLPPLPPALSLAGRVCTSSEEVLRRLPKRAFACKLSWCESVAAAPEVCAAVTALSLATAFCWC